MSIGFLIFLIFSCSFMDLHSTFIREKRPAKSRAFSIFLLSRHPEHLPRFLYAELVNFLAGVLDFSYPTELVLSVLKPEVRVCVQRIQHPKRSHKSNSSINPPNQADSSLLSTTRYFLCGSGFSSNL